MLEAMNFPEPVIAVAIEPKTKADQEKMGVALGKLMQEDPTFKVHTDDETGQTIIRGMGELHLEIIVDRMVREFNVDANVGKPQVAYRETITQRGRGPTASSSASPAAAASTATCKIAHRAGRAKAASSFSTTRSSAARSPRSTSSRSSRASRKRWRSGIARRATR